MRQQINGTGRKMNKINPKEVLNRIGKDLITYLDSIKFENREVAKIYKNAVEPGHKMRGCLVALGCSAVGGDPKYLLPAGAAIELLHKSSLVHDDIVDKDEYRRGLPSFYTIYGTEWGILNGDIISAVAFKQLSKLKGKFSEDKIVSCYRVFSNTFNQLYIGQMLDILFEERFDINEADYLDMVQRKTCSTIQCALAMGAILGGGTKEQIKLLSNFGKYFGISFQIKNDLNNLMGLEEKLGRRKGSDIYEKKRTLMIVHALNEGSPEEKELLTLYFKKQDLIERDVDAIINLLIKNRSIAYAADKVVEFANKARNSLEPLKDSEAKATLLSLVDYIGSESYWMEHIKKFK